MPQYIAEFDGGGSDAYAALCRLVEHDPVPEAAAPYTPLFRDFRYVSEGSHFTVEAMRALIWAHMSAIGCGDSRDWGAHSCRIGGATDLVSTGKASPLLRRKVVGRATSGVIWKVPQQ